MGHIDVNKVMKLIKASQNKKWNIAFLILDYAILKEKINNQADQSWYFQKALSLKRDQLKQMESEYIDFLNELNSHSLDQILELKTLLTHNLEEKKKSPKGFIQNMVLSSIYNQLSYIDALLIMKSKTDYLHDIDFYLNDSDELNKLMDT